MAFTATTQVDNQRAFGNRLCTLFRGTAGASGNTIDVNFEVEFIFGYPDAEFTQSGKTVTVTGLTSTDVCSLILVGKNAA